jgi:uncharacterized protein (DUF305 family)
MSRRNPTRSTAYRAAVGSLALAMTLALSACGGDDNTAAEQTGAAAGAIDESKPHEHDAEGNSIAPGAEAAGGAAADDHHDDAAAADGHEHTPGMDMSGGADHAEHEKDEKGFVKGIPADAPYNAQDVYFLQHMTAHHGQAVDMSALVKKYAKNAEVKKLGVAIHGAQAPEIAKMKKWLETWGQSTENDPHAHDEGGPSAGMMKPEELEELGKTRGKEFDKLFLEQMIFHHEGAVNQSKAEQAKGKYKPAKDLAGVIIKAQTKEIKLMKELLKKV